MFEVTGLSVAYGPHRVLEDVSMTVGEGELVVVLGSNGAGKTTLINAIAGMVPAQAGTVVFRGETVTAMPAHSRTAEGIATVPQGRGLFPDMTVAENLELGAFTSTDRIATAAHREHVYSLFPRLKERLRQRAETMSGGEQQMLAMGRAMMSGPSLLLLDEPSLGLSPVLTIDLFRAVRRIVDEGVSVLLVEQNARQSLKISDRAYLMEVGRIVGSGTAAEVQADKRVIAAYLGGEAKKSTNGRAEDRETAMYMTPYIRGKAIDVDKSSMSDVVNPYDQSTFSQVYMAGADDMRRAIDASSDAFPAWSKTPPAAREGLLIKAAQLLEERRDQFIDILISEAGSTTLKAGFEVMFTANMLRSAAGEARRITGDVMPSDIPGLMSLALRKPLGVVAGISPFNFPLILGTKKLCMAIAAGNTFVHKPSEETSLLALAVAEVFNDAGLPEGVLNVVPGDGPEMAKVILADERVKLVTFTGSTAVGRVLAEQCGKVGKKLTLEMGGKSPLVVLKDAEIDYAVDTAAFGTFIHQGQICMAGTRIIVEAPVYDAFVEAFARKVSGLKHGDPRDPATIIGPLIRARQCPFIKGHLDDAVAKGARIATGGNYEGQVFEPTVLADVTPEMSAFRTELFGPVAAVIRADDADHALALANDSSYGLSSAVLTNDLQLALKFADELEAGMVHINGPTVHDEPHIPFGGVKDSGSGREGGRWSMEEMTETKWVTIQRDHRHYPF